MSEYFPQPRFLGGRTRFEFNLICSIMQQKQI